MNFSEIFPFATAFLKGFLGGIVGALIMAWYGNNEMEEISMKKKKEFNNTEELNKQEKYVKGILYYFILYAILLLILVISSVIFTNLTAGEYIDVTFSLCSVIAMLATAIYAILLVAYTIHNAIRIYRKIKKDYTIPKEEK